MVHSVTWAALPEWVNEPRFPSGENQQILKELLVLLTYSDDTVEAWTRPGFCSLLQQQQQQPTPLPLVS